MLDLLLFGQKTAPNAFFDLRGGIQPPGSTFTRASAAWSFNSAGLLVQAGNNVARFDYDPVTLAPLGYLAEMQSTNGLLQSQDFTNVAWTASGLTPTTAQGTAPDGTNTLNKLVESNTSAAHRVSQAITLATATTAGFSWFVKASSRSKFFVSMQASANNYATAVFDTAGAGTTASETSVGSGSGTITSTNIRNVGGGIYRVSLQASVTGANPTVVFGLASLATGNAYNSTGDVTYAGDGASFAYGWGAQFDSAGVGITSYIPTAGSAVTRAQDILSLPLTSLPGWNPSKGGVLVAAYRLHTVAPGGNSQNPLYVTDGGTNSIDLRAQSGSQAGSNANGVLMRATTYQINIFGAGARIAPFTRSKIAFGYGITRGVLAHDGSIDATASGAFTLPIGMTTLYLGGDNGVDQLNGTLESIAYYAGARSDAFVQAVSR